MFSVLWDAMFTEVIDPQSIFAFPDLDPPFQVAFPYKRQSKSLLPNLIKGYSLFCLQNALNESKGSRQIPMAEFAVVLRLGRVISRKHDGLFRSPSSRAPRPWPLLVSISAMAAFSASRKLSHQLASVA
jgi:hypothetical protein